MQSSSFSAVLSESSVEAEPPHPFTADPLNSGCSGLGSGLGGTARPPCGGCFPAFSITFDRAICNPDDTVAELPLAFPGDDDADETETFDADREGATVSEPFASGAFGSGVLAFAVGASVGAFAGELAALVLALLTDSVLLSVEVLALIEVLDELRSTPPGVAPYPSEISASALRARSSARR